MLISSTIIPHRSKNAGYSPGSPHKEIKTKLQFLRINFFFLTYQMLRILNIFSIVSNKKVRKRDYLISFYVNNLYQQFSTFFAQYTIFTMSEYHLHIPRSSDSKDTFQIVCVLKIRHPFSYE